jgi:serine protease Do
MNPNEQPPAPETVVPAMELDPAPTPLDNAITAHPSAVPAEPASVEKRKPSKPRVSDQIAGGLWNLVVPVMFLLSLFFIAIYFFPHLVYHWKVLDAQAEAEATFLKRRAELKAEAEHADQRLDVLDKRVQLISLGFREVARKVQPNVVNITNYRDPTPKELDRAERNLLRLIYDPENDRKYVFHGVGSGVIYKPGVILTNHHVLRDAKRLRVTFPSGRSVGIDMDRTASDGPTDLAVIRLPENLNANLKEESQNVALFADSDKDVHVGDWTLAMGSPLDLRQTLTQGIISAKGRLLALDDVKLSELIQTDAAINPGNSGGPLFDQMGRVMGINVAIANNKGDAQGIGIGFAIPSNTAKKIAELLLTKGEVPRGYLGVAMEELPGPELKALKIDDGAILVKEVIAGEAAAKAGIKEGDVIVKVNKETLYRLNPIRHLRQLIADLEPGAEVTLELIRGQEHRQVIVTLGKRPANLR